VAIKSKLPLKAVRSERPSGERGFAGKRSVMAKMESIFALAYAEVGDVCEWGAFMRGENYGC